MTIIGLIVVLVVVGVLLYFCNEIIPMDSRIRQIINLVVILVVILWILGLFGLIPPLRQIR